MLSFLNLLHKYFLLTKFEIKRFATNTVCPHDGCAGKLIGWGFYQRKAFSLGRWYEIKVARKRCKSCTRTCSFLPPMLLRYCPWSLDDFRDPLKSIVLEGKSFKQAWMAMSNPNGEMEPRSFRKVLKRLRSLAEAGEVKVMAWIGRTSRNFEPEVPEKDQVREQAQKVNSDLWLKLGLLTVCLEAFERIRDMTGKERFSVMGLINYCGGKGNWWDLLSSRLS